MVVLEAAMTVAAIMVVMIVVVMMVMMIVIVAGLQEFRLDLEDAIEIEGAAFQHVGQRHPAALGAMQLGVGVDGANPRLDFGELGLRNKIGLVEHDDVGKGDL